MCGVFAYSGSEAIAAEAIMAGLRRLEYRGYDSWGIAILGDHGLDVERHVGRIGSAGWTRLGPARVGLGHTRWATHGGVTESNAHPHRGCGDRIAVVHNGVVENHAALRRDLELAGHRFSSETDSEVIAHLVEVELASGAGLATAVRSAASKLDGASAIVALDAVDGCLVAHRRGSPLVLGVLDGTAWIASDAAALVTHTRDVIFLQDGEVASVLDGRVAIFDALTGLPVAVQPQRLDWSVQTAERGDYPHFMLKEIAEQPGVWWRWAHESPAELVAVADMIQSAADVVLLGCGSAYHAALAGRYLLAAGAGIRARAALASEDDVLDADLGPGTLCLALSQSGETADVLRAARRAHQRGSAVAAFVNCPGSSLSRLAGVTVPLMAGPEQCVLATKSFTAKLAALATLVAAVSGAPELARSSLGAAARHAEGMLRGAFRSRARDTAARIATATSLFVLGKGSAYPLALEAALKVKEGSYLHAEGFAAGELKHGVIALVEPGTPCLALVLRDQTRPAMLAAVAEVRVRGGHVVALGPDPQPDADAWIDVPDAGVATPLLLALACQLLAYEVAVARGTDPDRPRNLAKSVTVV